MNEKQIIHKVTPLGSIRGEGLVIPNHSGDLSAGKIYATPSQTFNLTNKEYVDNKFNKCCFTYYV